jgi:alkylated DNA repair dioxygenase AlkB
MQQKELFDLPKGPPGFVYKPEFITKEEEEKLLEIFSKTPLKPYLYQGYLSKRKVKSFTKKTGYPEYLIPILRRVAKFVGVPFDSIGHAMITEYQPGTPIAWHRDQPPFEKIIGISLGSPVPFRFRKGDGKKWQRITITAEPRSIYIMAGPSRYEWQHSIPKVENLRYSLTMRTI